MKYTIEGFQQRKSIEMGLDVKDLVLLRWMIDFYNTGLMEFHSFNGKEYFWVDYKYLLQELPILAIESKDVLKRRLNKIVTSGLLEFRMFAGAGNKTYYRFIPEILRCLLSDGPAAAQSRPEGLTDRDVGGPYFKVGKDATQKSEGFLLSSSIPIDSSINDSSIRYGCVPSKKFVPPGVDDVKKYCRERRNKIDPEKFHAYYESNGWKAGRHSMKDWRAAVRYWESGNNNNPKIDNAPEKPADPNCSDCRGSGKKYAPGTGKSFRCGCTIEK